jgi:lysophospholipase L1-like esterase
LSETLKKILILPAVSILIFLGLSELTLHIFAVDPHPRGIDFTVNRAPDYPEVFLKDRDLFWRLRPNQTITSEFFQGKSYRINRQGFRGNDFIIEKKSLRVAVIGNSCGFGWGVNKQESFAGLLLQKLQTDLGMDDAEVYNFSVPGYSSLQGARNYSRYIRQYNPDIIIVTFGWNDQWISANNRPDKDQIMPPQIVVTSYNILSRLRFYRFFKSLIFSVTTNQDSQVSGQTVSRVGFSDFGANLGEIIQMARQDGARVVLLTSPIPSMKTYYHSEKQSVMHELHSNYNEITRETAASYSTGLVDLATIFDGYDNLFDDIKKDPFHYNVKGHILAADEIFQFLVTSDYLLINH